MTLKIERKKHQLTYADLEQKDLFQFNTDGDTPETVCMRTSTGLVYLESGNHFSEPALSLLHAPVRRLNMTLREDD